MKSFHNDSLSMIKSTDETHINIKPYKPKNEKQTFLPDIKVNIILDENSKFKNNDSDDSDFENNKRNMMTYAKLPQLRDQSKNVKGAGDKNYMKHNLSNQSLEIQINTVYPKNKENNKNKKEKVKFLIIII